MILLVIAILLLMVMNFFLGQASVLGHTPASNYHLRWDDDGNAVLVVKQNNTTRAEFRAMPTWTGLNGLTASNVHRTDFTLNGPFTNAGWYPFSMHHLGMPPSTYNLEKDWMNIGTTYTTDDDILHIGLMQRPTGSNNSTDGVIAWGDNNSGTDVDNFRFLFLSGVTDENNYDDQGLEIMRLAPSGKVGIGDFSTTGLNVQPTEKIDIDGTARLRGMPSTTSPNALILGIGTTAGDYVLKYRLLNGTGNQYFGDDGQWHSAAGFDCTWSEPTLGDLATGHAGTCNNGSVGIGLNPTISKLQVLNNEPGNTYALTATNDYTNNIVSYFSASAGGAGLNTRITGGTSFGPPAFNYGVKAETGGNGASFVYMYGLYGHGGYNNSGTSSGNSYGAFGKGEKGKNTYGVYGLGICGTDCGCELAVGVYGEAQTGSSNCQGGWAGYFNGRVRISSSLQVDQTWYTSDEELKSDIAPITNGIELIAQLKPSTYYFSQSNALGISLPEELQFGLLAQDVEETLPNLVKQFAIPQLTDEYGNVTQNGGEVKSINYIAITPILIASVQELNVKITLLEQDLANAQDNISTLSTALSECCAIDIQLKSMQANDIQIVPAATKLNELYQNTPNPFEQYTTMAYNLAVASAKKVVIYNQMGEVVTTLVDGHNEAGLHQVQWHSGSHASGVYYYALIIDGIEQVKKALKL